MFNELKILSVVVSYFIRTSKYPFRVVNEKINTINDFVDLIRKIKAEKGFREFEFIKFGTLDQQRYFRIFSIDEESLNYLKLTKSYTPEFVKGINLICI